MRLNITVDGISNPRTFQVFLTPSPAVSHDERLLTCVLTLWRYVPQFDGERWMLGRTGGGLLRRVCLDLVRGAVASASDRTFLGYFGQLVKYHIEICSTPGLFGPKP